MADLSRKCKRCEEKINIVKQSKGTVVFFDKRWYHLSCFLTECQEKTTPLKKGQKWQNALDNLSQLIDDTNNSIDYIIDSQQAQADIYEHMLKSYNTNYIPPAIFVRLNTIYNGTAKGMAKPIPPTHLLDMWKQKQKWLDKIAQNKNMDGVQRINYDLSILMGKYNDYLKWLDRERLKRAEEERIRAEQVNSIDYTKLGKTIINKKKNISDLFE